jgi:hypothetical protein
MQRTIKQLETIHYTLTLGNETILPLVDDW